MGAPTTPCALDLRPKYAASTNPASGLSVDILTYDGWLDFSNRRYIDPTFEDGSAKLIGAVFTTIYVVDSDLHNGDDSPKEYSIAKFGEIIKPSANYFSTYLKARSVESKTTMIRDLVSSGYNVDSNGRINSGYLTQSPTTQDFCSRVFYGTVVDKVVKKYPVYRICYLPITNNNQFWVRSYDPPAKATFLEYRTYEEYENQIGPIIIPDNISIASGKGVSEVPETDQNLCPSSLQAVFNCTDVDFGEINSDYSHNKTIDLINEGTLDLEVIDILVDGISVKSGGQNPNFTIGNFTSGGSITQPSPLNLPFDVEVGKTKTFNVFYSSNGLFGTQQTSEITYVVQTKGISIIPVVLDKTTSMLSALPYSVNVVCDDISWGEVDGISPVYTQNGSIKNLGNKEIYMTSFELSGTDSSYFENVSIKLPISILPNETYNYSVDYRHNGYYDILHSAMLKFTFTYSQPGSSSPTTPVSKTKFISNLSAQAFFEDPWNPVTGDDEDGVFVDKVFSKVIDVSLPVSKNRTYPLWKCNSEKLNTFFTSSNGSKLDTYFLSVYDDDPSNVRSFKEFEISYGHIDGSGSLYLESETNLMPSKAMYSKYKVDTFGLNSGSFGEVQPFIFKNGVIGRSVYFIQFDRDMFRDMIDPGNFQLSLAPLSSSADQLVNTGSNFYVDPSSSITYTLIDDSFDTKQRNTDQFSLRTHYNLVSGSLKDGVYSEPGDNAWGMFFPQSGLIVLDGGVLDQSCSFNTVTASIDGDNIRKLFLSISGSAAYSENRTVTESFFARSAERNLVQTYFCRASQDEFNYSNNPTYVSGSSNDIKNYFFVKEPQTYITSIGLYNRQRELIAIGKLKQPLLKKQNTNYVFEVRVRIM